TITALAGCLTYITPGSPKARPAKDCCAGVKSTLGSPAAVACLCGALGLDFGIKINYTRVAALPAACGGNFSALSKCNSQYNQLTPICFFVSVFLQKFFRFVLLFG
ncbi:Os02g0286350, partial [Oryza sativa Japonica Group]